MAKIQILEGPMKGGEFNIDKEVIFVGRDPETDFQIRDSAISRNHLKIFSVESCYFIEDLKTKNGTMTNGELLDPGFPRLITENDLIQLGSSVIRLEGIGANKPPITVENIEPSQSEKAVKKASSVVYSGKERRSRVFQEVNFIYDLLQLVGEISNTKQVLEKVTESLFEAYPRIDKVSAILFDDEKDRMEEIVSRRRQGSAGRETFYSKAILDQAIQDGKIATVYLRADAARDGFTNDLDTVAAMAVICLPLMIGERVCGAIYIWGFQESNPVRKEDFLVLKTVKRLLELSLEVDALKTTAAAHTGKSKRG